MARAPKLSFCLAMHHSELHGKKNSEGKQRLQMENGFDQHVTGYIGRLFRTR